MSLISILSLPFILLVQKFIKFYKKLNANIFLYLIVLTRLRILKWKSPKKRFDLYNPLDDYDIQKLGLLESEEEWLLEKPRIESNENLYIYGINSNGQTFVLIMKNRNIENDSRIDSSVKCLFKDNDNSIYSIDETVCTQRQTTFYSSCGISVEVLNPLRRLRIKISCYMKNINGNNELVYMRARFMWFAFSNVFDYQNDYDLYFTAQQIASQSKNWNFIPETENSFEQFGQLKGTIQLQNKPLKEVFLWGIRNKKLFDKHQEYKVETIHGFVPNKGIGFNLRLTKNSDNNHKFFNGVFFHQSIHPITDLTVNDTNSSFSKKFQFKSNNKEYKVVLTEDCIESSSFDLKINEFEGKCLVNHELEESFTDHELRISDESSDHNHNDLVISLTNKFANCVSISGGKGLSLHELINLKNECISNGDKTDPLFDVPNGCIVTTNAYQLVSNLEEMKKQIDFIEKVEKFVWIKDKNAMKNKCLKLEAIISELEMPQIIKNNIRDNLMNIFNGINIDSIQFSVRSSATAEDSEEMSFAGQMKTFLGVKGLDNIYSSVMKCWASQFTYIAMEYKLEYGQPINVPMAVVIQQMVNCDSAGVAFSCDPLSGDGTHIVITANYGLGESVVSSTAEPDTITLSVNTIDNSFETRTIAGIESIDIGSKLSSIRMTENGTLTTDESNDKTNKCCISEDMVLKLGRVILRVQQFFGSVRDIEWGVKNGTIYLLQSRPLTNLNSFSEWEICHQLDSPHLSDNEYSTRGNIGEVCPGSCSYLSLTTIQNIGGVCSFRALHQEIGLPIDQFCPNRTFGFRIAYNQAFMSLNEAEFLKPDKDGKLSLISKAAIIAIFGHELDDENMIRSCGESLSVMEISIYHKIKRALLMINTVWNSKKLFNKCKKKYENFDLLEKKTFSNAEEMFDHLQNSLYHSFEPYNSHMNVSIASSIYNLMTLNLLSNSSDMNEPNKNLYSDFANLLSSCNDVISADVPKALRKIVDSIEDQNSLKEMSETEILEWFQSTDSRAGILFKQFISEHGHRCYGEFDIYRNTWSEEPIKVIQSINV